MAIITVGKQHEQQFNNIVKLAQKGFLMGGTNGGIVKSVQNGKIVTQEHEYVLGSVEIDENRHASHKYNGSGSNWFGGFRGEEVNEEASAWANFIRDVSEHYRERYSFVEFEQVRTQKQMRQERMAIENLTSLLRCVIGENVDYEAPNLRSTKDVSKENIYGLSMRIKVSAGAGESMPIMCKMYFRRTKDADNPFEPIKKSEAFEIESLIANATPDGEDINDVAFPQSDRNELERVYVALEKCITDDNGKSVYNFTDYVILSGEQKGSRIIVAPNAPNETDTDFGIVRTMLKNNGFDKRLSCNNMEILGVSHLIWENTYFNIKQNGNVVMRATVGLNNAIGLKCLNCGGEDSIIIEAGVLRGDDGMSWVLDPSANRCGFTNDVIQQIRLKSVLSKHLCRVDCSGETLDRCSRTVCRSQMLMIGNEWRCKSCTHPEIVYLDIFDGAAQPVGTRTATFVTDDLTFIPENPDNTFTCDCCGRTYTERSRSESNFGSYDLCKHCDSLDEERGKEIYRRYRNMLSPMTRLTHLFDKKYCTEYRGTLIFTLGKQKYTFDMLGANEHGLLRGPKKYRPGRSRRS